MSTGAAAQIKHISLGAQITKKKLKNFILQGILTTQWMVQIGLKVTAISLRCLKTVYDNSSSFLVGKGINE